MKVINLVRRDFDDPFAFIIGEDHKFVISEISDSDPLRERFKDARTVYEQYCDGEKYLRYDEETLYSRSAHEWMWSNASRYPHYHPINYKIHIPRGV